MLNMILLWVGVYLLEVSGSKLKKSGGKHHPQIQLPRGLDVQPEKRNLAVHATTLTETNLLQCDVPTCNKRILNEGKSSGCNKKACRGCAACGSSIAGAEGAKIIPCQMNTGIFPSQVNEKDAGKVEEVIPTNAASCADLCAKDSYASFAYFWKKGAWSCKCVPGTFMKGTIRYWEGGVTGKVNCFQAGSPVDPKLKPVPPVYSRISRRYSCWSSGRRFPRCWRPWRKQWEHRPADNCFNSYTMLWKGFRFCRSGQSHNGQEYGKDITFNWCLKICEKLEDCIGIKWSKDNRCWLHTSALYVEGAPQGSCEEKAVFKKINFKKIKKTQHIPSSISLDLDRTCPCGASRCAEMSTCLQQVLKSASPAQKSHCLLAQIYGGGLSSLPVARAECDLTLQKCQGNLPTCYLKMSLAWEQGLLNLYPGTSLSFVALGEQKHLNDGAAQALLQRSGRGPEAGDNIKLTTFDFDGSGNINIQEFETFLRSRNYPLPQSESEMIKIFNEFDNPPKDGVLDGGEWAVLVKRAFCPCANGNPPGVSLVQGSDKEALGLDDAMDNVYERKMCR